MNDVVNLLVIPPAFPRDFSTPPPLVKMIKVVVRELESTDIESVSYNIAEIWGEKVHPKPNTKAMDKLNKLRDLYKPPLYQYVRDMQKRIDPFREIVKSLQPITTAPALRHMIDMQKRIDPFKGIVKSLQPMDLGFRNNPIFENNLVFSGLSVDFSAYENVYKSLYSTLNKYRESPALESWQKTIVKLRELEEAKEVIEDNPYYELIVSENETLQKNNKAKDKKIKKQNKTIANQAETIENKNKELEKWKAIAFENVYFSFNKARNDVEASAPIAEKKPQPQPSKKPEVITLDSKINNNKIAVIHKHGNAVFIATLNQWENFFSAKIQPMQPIELRRKTTLMDLRLFLDKLKEIELINEDHFLSIVERVKAFSFNKKPVTSRQLRIDNKRGNYPYTKNEGKVNKIFEALRKPPSKR